MVCCLPATESQCGTRGSGTCKIPGPCPSPTESDRVRAEAGILSPRGHSCLQHFPALLHFRFIPSLTDIFISKSKAQRSPVGGSRHVVVSSKAGMLLEALDSKRRALFPLPITVAQDPWSRFSAQDRLAACLCLLSSSAQALLSRRGNGDSAVFPAKPPGMQWL